MVKIKHYEQENDFWHDSVRSSADVLPNENDKNQNKTLKASGNSPKSKQQIKKHSRLPMKIQ